MVLASEYPDANSTLRGAPTLAVHERYTGIVWDHLDLASLTSTQRTRALTSIVVISGLLGAVSAADPVPDYRLKMGARFAPFGLLSKWWHDSLSETLNKAFKGAVVIDLLPQEHRAAFTLDTDMIGEYFVVGLNEKSGKAGGHDAKAAKGKLARHLRQGRQVAFGAPTQVQALAFFGVHNAQGGGQGGEAIFGVDTFDRHINRALHPAADTGAAQLGAINSVLDA